MKVKADGAKTSPFSIEAGGAYSKGVSNYFISSS